MREALRGALLSVLFFGLMIGGAPSMVAAELHSVSAAHKLTEQEGPCQTNGHINTSGGCMSPEAFKHHNDCRKHNGRAGLGGLIGAIGVLGMLVPEPITTAAGMGATIGGAIGVIWGLGGMFANDCF